MNFSLDELFSSLGTLIERYREKILIGFIIITIIAGWGWSRVQPNLTITSLLPLATEKVEALQSVHRDFSPADPLIAVIEGDNPEIVRRAVDAIELELAGDEYNEYLDEVYSTLSIGRLVNSLSYRGAIHDISPELFDNTDPVGFTDQLNSVVQGLLTNKNPTEKEKRQMHEKLDSIASMLRGIGSTQETVLFSGMIDALTAGEEYQTNSSEQMALIFIFPSFTTADRSAVTEGVSLVEAGIAHYKEQFGVEIGLTGTAATVRDEALKAGTGLGFAFLLTFLLSMLLLVFSYRMKTAPLLIGIPLLLGIFWTAGAAGFLFGRITILTGAILVVVMGFGINYAIRFLTAFIQERERGKPFADSLCVSYEMAGRSMLIGALAAAAAFLSLMAAKSGILREAGLILGFGTLIELLMMTVLLPMFLSYRNSFLIKTNRKDSIVRIHSASSGGRWIGKGISRMPGFVFLTFSAFAVILLLHSPKLVVQSDLMEMEPHDLGSLVTGKRMEALFGLSPDVLYISSDSIEETRQIVPLLRNIDGIRMVESVADFLPEEGVQQDFLEVFAIERGEETLSATSSDFSRLQLSIGFLIDNLKLLARRYEYPGYINFAASLNTIFRDTALMMSHYRDLNLLLADYLSTSLDEEPVTLENLPNTVKDHFLPSDGALNGRNLIILYPRKTLWNEANREKLMQELEGAADNVTGLALAIEPLTEVFEQDAKRASVIGLVLVLIVLLVNFRNFKLSLMILATILAAEASFLGAMDLLGKSLNFINSTAIFLILGIGLEFGVQLANRYRKTGVKYLETAIEKTGRAMVLTTLTAVLGFFTFLPAGLESLQTFGIALALGMISILTLSLFLLSSLLVICADRMKWSIKPWGDSY